MGFEPLASSNTSAMRNMQRILFGPRKSRHCQTWLEQLKTVSPRGMKTFSERRIELRNLQILKKMLKKSGQFLRSEQPCELRFGRCVKYSGS